jgi:hypothetical protein
LRVASAPVAQPVPATPPSAPPQSSASPAVVASSGPEEASEKMTTYYRRGIADYKAEHFQSAAVNLWKAVNMKDPSVPSYYYAEADLLLGVMYQFHSKLEGHLKDAKRFYQAALDKEPGNAAARKHLRELSGE